MDKHSYEAPSVRDFGSIKDLTASLDKVGSIDDIFTPIVPLLDGDIQDD